MGSILQLCAFQGRNTHNPNSKYTMHSVVVPWLCMLAWVKPVLCMREWVKPVGHMRTVCALPEA